MKRGFLSISMLLLTMLMLFTAASIGVAYSKDTAVCWHIAEKVTIDADLKEWNTSAPVQLNRQEQLIRDANQWSRGRGSKSRCVSDVGRCQPIPGCKGTR